MAGRSICLIPCREGSQRVLNKNLRPFGPFQYGLFENKLEQVVCAGAFDEILVSSNQATVEHLVEDARANNGDQVRFLRRPDQFCSSNTTTDQLINHFIDSLKFEDDDIIFWTHVTSPFFGPNSYKNLVENYEDLVADGYDSMMTVGRLQQFVLVDGKPVNFGGEVRWPYTQTLTNVQHVNNALFGSSWANYKKHRDRIGRRPLIVELSRLESFDVDDELDFEFANYLYNRNFECNGRDSV